MTSTCRHVIFLFFILLTCAVCRADTGASFQPASAVLQRITGSDVRAFSTRDFGRERFAGAISALVDQTKAEGMLRAVRKELPGGFVAFIGTTRSLTTPPATGVELVIGRGNGPLDILDISATDAVNYDMDTKDIQLKLGRWHKAHGIEIWQAESDTIQLRFLKMPGDIKALAKEVYKFCPDVVDQGVGTQDALIRDIKKMNGLYLWWD
jgi:hypothetical protein